VDDSTLGRDGAVIDMRDPDYACAYAGARHMILGHVLLSCRYAFIESIYRYVSKVSKEEQIALSQSVPSKSSRASHHGMAQSLPQK
jgi:hypothetical protein